MTGKGVKPVHGVPPSVERNGSRRQATSRALWLSVAALFFTPVALAQAADFPSVVATILNNQSDGRIAKLEPATKQEMVNCVNRVLAGLPNGKKRFVVEGANYNEQEDRFGKVVKENRAEWEQKIAKGCGQIVMRGMKGIGHQ